MPCLERLLVLIRWHTLPNSLFTNVCRYNKNCKDCQHLFSINIIIIWYLLSSIFNYATFIHIERHLIPVLHWFYFLFFICIYLSQMSFFLSLCNQFGVICNVKLIRLYLEGWYVCQNMHNRWRSVIAFREHRYTSFWRYLISRKLRY